MLSSPHNELIRRARSLLTRKGRERARAFLVETPRALATVLEAGAVVDTVLVAPDCHDPVVELARRAGARVEAVTAELLEAVTETVTPCGCVGLVATPAPRQPDWPRRLLVLDEVRDPGNVGALLRTADAAGAGVVLCGGCADPLAPKVVRASAGAVVRVPWWRAGAAETARRLAEQGQALVVLDGRAPDSLYDEPLPHPLAVVVGNETHGVGETLASLGRAVRLPMRPGAESLNAALAGAVALYEVVRQHGLGAGDEGAQ